MLCLASNRQIFRLSNLRGSHTACDPISAVSCAFLNVTRRVSRCEVSPHIGTHVVLRYAISGLVQRPESILRQRVTLSRRFLVPLPCLNIVLRDAPSNVVKIAETSLPSHISLGCGIAVRLQRTVRVHQGHLDAATLKFTRTLRALQAFVAITG